MFSRPDNLVKCPQCSSTWFEEVRVFQVEEHHVLVPGQKVPRYKDAEYSVLRCVRCSELVEPQMQISPRDYMKSHYGSMVDDLEDPAWKASVRTKAEKL